MITAQSLLFTVQWLLYNDYCSKITVQRLLYNDYCSKITLLYNDYW